MKKIFLENEIEEVPVNNGAGTTSSQRNATERPQRTAPLVDTQQLQPILESMFERWFSNNAMGSSAPQSIQTTSSTSAASGFNILFPDTSFCMVTTIIWSSHAHYLQLLRLKMFLQLKMKEHVVLPVN